MIVVDTDILIEILDKGSDIGEQALTKIKESTEPIAITSITLHEILYGRFKKSKDVGDILDLPVISYTREDARLSALLEVSAEKGGRKVSRLDSMIAAVSINHGARLYTNNIRDFSGFEGIELFE